MGTMRLPGREAHFVQGLLSKPAFQDKLDMNAIAAAVSQGLGDDKVIKPSAHALMCALCELAPSAVLAHLKEGMITPLSKTLALRLKDDIIPQEVRRCAGRSMHAVVLVARTPLLKALRECRLSTTVVSKCALVCEWCSL
jgi:hypothetical protein